MKIRLLRKWRRNLVISFVPAIFEDEEDKYCLHDWNKKCIVMGTLKECIDYQHNILNENMKLYEAKINKTICNRINL